MAGSDSTPQRCPECGAPIPAEADCQTNFHALLALEYDIPGGPGKRTHFLAVATYGIQHARSMGYTVETVEGLRKAVCDVLEDSVTIADIRQRVGDMAKAAGRVTRRAGDVVPSWSVEAWPLVVTDAVTGGIDGYQDRVERWARSVSDTLGSLHT